MSFDGVTGTPSTGRGGRALQPRKDRPAVFLNKKRAYQGTGRRKSAVARIYLTEGDGKITINGRTLDDYFTEDKDRAAVLGPLKVMRPLSRWKFTARCSRPRRLSV